MDALAQQVFVMSSCRSPNKLDRLHQSVLLERAKLVRAEEAVAFDEPPIRRPYSTVVKEEEADADVQPSPVRSQTADQSYRSPRLQEPERGGAW